jgi:hypothetical protein
MTRDTIKELVVFLSCSVAAYGLAVVMFGSAQQLSIKVGLGFIFGCLAAALADYLNNHKNTEAP